MSHDLDYRDKNDKAGRYKITDKNRIIIRGGLRSSARGGETARSQFTLLTMPEGEYGLIWGKAAVS